MCWTRSKLCRVEEHVLLLDSERVRISLPEGVVEDAAARGETVAGDARRVDLLHHLRSIEWPWKRFNSPTRGRPTMSPSRRSRPGGELGRRGDASQVFRWASLTKPVTALAALVAAEEGTIDLDEPAGPPGSTMRHLLAHASGLPFDAGAPIAKPGTRRIYSNAGIEVGRRADRRSTRRCRLPSICRRPCSSRSGCRPSCADPPSAGLYGTLDDLAAFVRELFAPTLIAPETLAEAVSVQFPGLAGVIPDLGRFDPNDWGLGFELKDGKQPHFSGTLTSPAHVRPLGRERHVLLGRPGAEPGARRADRPRVRRLGEGSVAGIQRRSRPET